MNFIRRIVLFLMLNFLILFSINIILTMTGINDWIAHEGWNPHSALVFCFVYGMAGSLISLLLSKTIAAWSCRMTYLSKGHPLFSRLHGMVERLSRKIGLPTPPDIGLFHSSTPNAFATGYSKRSALVGLSYSLVEQMSDSELEAVIGHELAHIENGDMVTMTLLQGVINTFVIYLSWLIASFIGRTKDRKHSFTENYALQRLLSFVFSLFGALLMAAFSRWREYRADAGSARITSRQQMISALKKLDAYVQLSRKEEMGEEVAALCLVRKRKENLFFSLFSTHPPIEKRIERLKQFSIYSW